MRAIRFRAWHKESKEYKYMGINSFNFGGFRGIIDDLVGNDTAIWEQDTGLQDKNGKEIYEGSLVKYTEDGDSFISEVKYFGNDDYPAFDIEAPSAFYFESNVLSSGIANNCLEVVGNIHENPELLEVSK